MPGDANECNTVRLATKGNSSAASRLGAREDGRVSAGADRPTSSFPARPACGSLPSRARGRSLIEFRADTWEWIAHAPVRPGRTPTWALRRRGMDHGALRRGAARRLSRAEAGKLWKAAEPLHLAGALDLRSHRSAIARTVTTFDRLRRHGDLTREVWRRCPDGGAFESAGASTDMGDEREIEKVHADQRRGGRLVARDLWAKLSWISRDPRDESLRIRFSFGSERLDDWRGDPARASAADDFAETVFPECALLSRHAPLDRLLTAWTGRRCRLSERILFENAPDGGAVFHHDAEEGQLGVLYGQLTGRTAWLALSKRALTREVATLAGGKLARAARSEAAALRTLERDDLPALDRLLNRSRRLTRRLVERGSIFVLRPGDAILLPSHGPDDAAWHSVFALGSRPGLAHSYGIFPRRAR